MSKSLSVDQQFREYVARGFNGLLPEQLPVEQERELRRAFFMSWAQCLFLIRDNISLYPEKIAVKILEGMVKEIEKYLTKELIDHLKSN